MVWALKKAPVDDQAALLVLIGVRKMKQVKAPERALEQGREIPKALKGQS